MSLPYWKPQCFLFEFQIMFKLFILAYKASHDLIPVYHFDYIKNSAFFTAQVPAYSFLPPQKTTLAVSCLRVLTILTHCSTYILNNTQLNGILSIYTIGYLFALCVYFLFSQVHWSFKGEGISPAFISSTFLFPLSGIPPTHSRHCVNIYWMCEWICK